MSTFDDNTVLTPMPFAVQPTNVFKAPPQHRPSIGSSVVRGWPVLVHKDQVLAPVVPRTNQRRLTCANQTRSRLMYASSNMANVGD